MSEESRARPWRDIDILWILALYVAFYLAVVVFQLFLFGAIVSDKLRENLGYFIFEELIDASLLALLPVYFVVKVYQSHLREIGFSFDRLTRNAILGVIAGVALFGVVSVCEILIEFVFGLSSSHEYLQLLEKATSLSDRVVICLSLFILAPLSEEIYFRGFAYTVLKKNHGRVIAIVASATLFASVHFSVASFVPIVLVGVLLALLLDRTSSLVPPLVAHSVFNILTVST